MVNNRSLCNQDKILILKSKIASWDNYMYSLGKFPGNCIAYSHMCFVIATNFINTKH